MEENQRQIEKEKHCQDVKRAQNQEAMNLVKEGNILRIAAKKAAKEAEAQEDKELMDETLATLERQEKKRAQALADFQVCCHQTLNLRCNGPFSCACA